MTDRTRRILSGVIKVCVGLGVITYVVLTGRLDPRKVVDWRWIAAGFAVLLSIAPIGCFRWWTLVRAQGIDLGVYSAFRIQMIGVFFNAFLFGATGGDVFKAYYIATGEGSDRKAALKARTCSGKPVLKECAARYPMYRGSP